MNTINLWNKFFGWKPKSEDLLITTSILSGLKMDKKIFLKHLDFELKCVKKDCIEFYNKNHE